ncbi:branched-chain amino acid ABC transporter permease [Vineibacter terrae]|uniref:branched-chain amino acid ABC transporter permease n=1 Tax=Vineibacter terrae TaxID=2586908 RepID=UPI002E37A2F6|nr:branched-chain amino acid ABC transporter permease [Vineibacter terrae]HEX2889530.1 branched-chain amino acid ABC transporter permease [Vineibacter terrae]
MPTVQLLVNALALGAAYALVALGFVLVLNAAGAVNFAHGDMVMLGGVAAVAASTLLAAGGLRLPGIVLLPLVVIVSGLVGLVVAAVGFWPLRDRPPAAMFVATIALAAVFEQSATAFFGPEPRAAPAVWDGAPIIIGGIALGRQPLALILVAGLALAGVYALLERTQIGRRFRAVAQDREMARALGLRATRLIVGAFALAGGLAGLAGALLGHHFFVNAGQGPAYMLKAYIATAIGGWGSVPGALVGALLIALFETLVSAALSAVWAQALLYLSLLAILLLRPQGLFGEAVGRRA